MGNKITFNEFLNYQPFPKFTSFGLMQNLIPAKFNSLKI